MAYTASFLTVNGLAVPVMAAGQRRTDPDRWGRGNGAAYSGTTYAKRRQFALETPPVPPLEAQALSGWVRGLGHHFTFEWTDDHRATTQFTLYSTDGGAAMSGGSAATTSAKFGSYALLVAGNDVHTATALFGSEAPYSFSVWRNQLSANVWELCSAAHDGATTRYYAGTDGTGVTTAFAWSSLVATDGYLRVALEGQNPAGSSSTCLYDGLMILPFSLTTPQLAARVGRLNAEPPFPLVAVGGHWTQVVPEIACKGFVKDYPVHRAVLDNRWYDNARQVVGTLVESHELTAETVLPVPTLEELILADPDLFLYYPLTDAAQPATVADLGPNGFDLTVSDPNNLISFGNTGPNAQIPLTMRVNMTWAAVVAGYDDNYLYRSQASGISLPNSSITFSFIGRPEAYPDYPSKETYATLIKIYRSGTAGGLNVKFNRTAGVNQASFYYGNQNYTFSHPSPTWGTVANLYTYVLDLNVGTYGTRYLYINGTLVGSNAVPGSFSQDAQLCGLVLGADPNNTAAPPTATNLGSTWRGGLCHVFLSARAYSAAEVLALAQAAGFA